MKYLWLDLETAGLADSAPLLEIYCVLADETYQGAPFHAVIWQDLETLEMDPRARQMHEQNGLLAEVATGLPLQQVERGLLEHFADVDITNRPLILAGKSVQHDLRWMNYHFPNFSRLLSHRIFDVTTLWQFLGEYYPTDFTSDQHRAETDVKNALAQFRYYREKLFGIPGIKSAQTVEQLTNLLRIQPGNSPLCVSGVFKEYRPITVSVSPHTFTEDQYLRSCDVTGTIIEVKEVF